MKTELTSAINAADNAVSIYKLGFEGRRHWLVIRAELDSLQSRADRAEAELESQEWFYAEQRKTNVELQKSLDAAYAKADRAQSLFRRLLESGTWFTSAVEFHDRQGKEIKQQISEFLAEGGG